MTISTKCMLLVKFRGSDEFTINSLTDDHWWMNDDWLDTTEIDVKSEDDSQPQPTGGGWWPVIVCVLAVSLFQHTPWDSQRSETETEATGIITMHYTLLHIALLWTTTATKQAKPSPLIFQLTFFWTTRLTRICEISFVTFIYSLFVCQITFSNKYPRM